MCAALLGRGIGQPQRPSTHRRPTKQGRRTKTPTSSSGAPIYYHNARRLKTKRHPYYVEIITYSLQLNAVILCFFVLLTKARPWRSIQMTRKCVRVWQERTVVALTGLSLPARNRSQPPHPHPYISPPTRCDLLILKGVLATCSIARH